MNSVGPEYVGKLSLSVALKGNAAISCSADPKISSGTRNLSALLLLSGSRTRFVRRNWRTGRDCHVNWRRLDRLANRGRGKKGGEKTVQARILTISDLLHSAS